MTRDAALHKRGDVHRDQHDNIIEDYHVCGCQPSDGEALRLLRDAQPTGFEMPPVEWWRRRDAYLAARFDAYLAARPGEGAMRRHPRMPCPRCGESVLLNQDGKPRKHRRWHMSEGYGDSYRWVPCDPAPEADPE